jgi:hypothetical protein
MDDEWTQGVHNLFYVVYFMLCERWSFALQKLELIDQATEVTRGSVSHIRKDFHAMSKVYGFKRFAWDITTKYSKISEQPTSNQTRYMEMSLATDSRRQQRTRIELAVKALNL